ncbi:MAG: 50S ribosomal protein L19 [Candidatus Niyogibacteria bacterium RIFCSPLOWO2_01_FULL_45_48]|uniref:50S ribosomal protein L19 n=2 Tax=Candidatus Niyogiibacteriota TaxID=1817912 RepID=A0A1G2EZ50_9BACT|nr:MAG: 50S ribosomal protein L19 [Candidatus Niyogibacteria bacterium RIFCSPHIGHO2_01_FULL_45_28]OGZ30792.1 MAG: 50S ribosomal protein L19 [Candidatus Niyogibacteria bacterium RIFCSPLOWO2_02_FULL_45_13]OGZ31312.1 MAG: 50S ribosomal protein L19 [Candidatus Niyogibacteria bacterium RIFCSPLOWO2_01_FULL_45_48]
MDIEARAKMDFGSGDTIRVWQRVKEGDKSRLQAFEGLVIARKHGRESGATITVRKVSSGVGVERIFPLYSPTIEKIEIVSHSKVRRAKLYYVRDKAAREMRKKMKQLTRVEKVVMEKPPEKQENKEEEKETDKK